MPGHGCGALRQRLPRWNDNGHYSGAGTKSSAKARARKQKEESLYSRPPLPLALSLASALSRIYRAGRLFTSTHVQRSSPFILCFPLSECNQLSPS